MFFCILAIEFLVHFGSFDGTKKRELYFSLSKGIWPDLCKDDKLSSRYYTREHH